MNGKAQACKLESNTGVKLLDDAHKMVVTVEAHGLKVSEEEAAAAAAGEGAETAEPEVIKRGKATAEEAEE